MKKIAENIRKLRLNKKLTQQKLCYKISEQGYHIKRNTYTRYESGNRTIPYELICHIAIYYNVSTDYILGLKDLKLEIRKSHLQKNLHK